MILFGCIWLNLLVRHTGLFFDVRRVARFGWPSAVSVATALECGRSERASSHPAVVKPDRVQYNSQNKD